MKIGMGKLRKKWIIGLILGFIALGIVACGVVFFEKKSKKIAKTTSYTIIDGTIHINVQRYRALNYNKDTTVWELSDCKIEDSTFSCFRYDDKNVRRSNPYSRKSPKSSDYRDTVYDTTYTDINFGKNALVHYIPVAKIPEFDRKAVAKALSKLPGAPCSQIFQFRSNYNLEVVGLPGFSWKNRDGVAFGYEAYIDSEKSGQKKCSVQSARVEYTPSNHHFQIIKKSLPEQLKDYTLQFFNGTLQTFRDTTISWKLVYEDQYRRKDTLDITTKFEVDESSSLKKGFPGSYDGRCYDAVDSTSCK